MRYLLFAGCCLTSLIAFPISQAADIDFAHEVQPILSKRCSKCHSGTQRKGGLSINTRQSLLTGGESGRVVLAGKSGDSPLLARLAATDDSERMPPEGEPLTKQQIETLRRWIDSGLPWEDGFSFGKTFARAPLAPRHPDVPAGDGNPIDRFLHSRLAALNTPPITDRTFARRAFLDLIGLLPTPNELDEFINDTAPNKREKLIDRLLTDRRNYADHWLTFWNDLLRNAYQGTGFIDGGRKQITGWLYESLLTNKPYDQFVRELIESAPGAEGFSFGIKWRGTVNESQRREIQAAQSISQVFLGTNLKCASCHDSFVNDWKLTDAYALASVFADAPLELHRCDKPTGKPATVGFLYPELGQIESTARPERQKQLATLLTKPENGRFARVIVNRLWAKLMGRGLTEPLDNLDAESWHRDLLDWLASNFVEHGHDLQHTLRMIATSRAYQLPAVGLDDDELSDEPFEFCGPLVKRLSSEQFVDAVTSLTNTWRPISLPLLRVDGRGQSGQLGAIARAIDGARRGSPDPAARTTEDLPERSPNSGRPAVQSAAGSGDPRRAQQLFANAKWLWANADAQQAPANKAVFFRKTLKLDRDMPFVFLTIAADNECDFYINGQKVADANNWQQPTQTLVGGPLKVGDNVLAARVVNKGTGPNPAGFIAEMFAFDNRMHLQWTQTTDDSWLANETSEKDWEKPNFDASNWQAAVVIGDSQLLPWNIADVVAKNSTLLTRDTLAALQDIRLRASLLPQDQLQSALGRPHREQVVSHRESLATMLQALELTNGSALDEQLQRGAEHWLREVGSDPNRLIATLSLAALGREPTSRERELAAELLGSPPTKTGLADLLWTVILLPEFQLVP
ncbi:MAG: DUF1549 domain-containing protein [Planctomycetaceae bacterium]